MVTCKYRGRLGNIMLSMYSSFWYAEKAGVGKEDVLFNREYSIAPEGFFLETEKSKKVDYIGRNWELFGGVERNFLRPNEYLKRVETESPIVIPTPDWKPGQDLPKAAYLDDYMKRHSAKGLPKSAMLDNYKWHRPETPSERSLFRSLFWNAPVCRRLMNAHGNYFADRSSVAFHIRRGDFAIANGGCFMQNEDVIRERMKFLSGSTVVVFSDDIEWCRKNVGKPPFGSILFHKPLERECLDMLLMSCFSRISVNDGSTFSECALYMSRGVEATGWKVGGQAEVVGNG